MGLAVASMRSRWAAIGAAVAVTLGAGGLMTASANISDGERSAFVSIRPCRLLDTRPAPENVGARSTPLGPDETYDVSVVGVSGQCEVPIDATAVVFNLAVIDPTDASFVTAYPTGQTRPLSSSINFTGGQPPDSNAATIEVGAAGFVSFYNLAGFVNLAVDITGYFADHDHDDRYQRKQQTLIFDGLGAVPHGDAQLGTVGGCASNASGSGTPTLELSAPLPAGTAINGGRVLVYDGGSDTYDFAVRLRTVESASVTEATLMSATGGDEVGSISTHQFALTVPADVLAGQSVVLSFHPGTTTPLVNGLCQLQLDVVLP